MRDGKCQSQDLNQSSLLDYIEQKMYNKRNGIFKQKQT